MRTLIVALSFVLVGSLPVSAAEKLSPEDAYMACVIGRGVVEMNHDKPVLDAQNTAQEACAALAPKIEDTDQIEALDDFIGMILDKLAPEATETTHL